MLRRWVRLRFSGRWLGIDIKDGRGGGSGNEIVMAVPKEERIYMFAADAQVWDNFESGSGGNDWVT